MQATGNIDKNCRFSGSSQVFILSSRVKLIGNFTMKYSKAFINSSRWVFPFQ